MEEEEAYYQVDDEESPVGPWGTTHGQQGNGVGCARGVGRGKSLATCPDIQGPSFVTSLLNLSKASN